MPQDAHPSALKKKETGYIVQVKYRNKLPLPPMPPVLLPIEIPSSRYTYHNATNRLWIPPIMIGPILGGRRELKIQPQLKGIEAHIDVDLTSEARKCEPMLIKYTESDQFLLAPLATHVEKNKLAKTSPQSKKQNTAIFNNWLRKAQYAEGATRQFGRTTKKKYNVQHPTKQNQDEHGNDHYVERIARSFEAMQKPPVHPTKGWLKPKQTLSVEPNFDNWSCKYTLLALEDGDPALKTWREDMADTEIAACKAQQRARAEQAILQPYVGQDLVPALGYFLPTNETPDENDEHDEDDEDVLPIPGVVYEHIRDYNFTTGAAHKMDPMKKTKNVCFSMDESGQKVRWVDVGYTVKARRKAGMPKREYADDIAGPTHLHVKRKKIDAEEEALNRDILVEDLGLE